MSFKNTLYAYAVASLLAALVFYHVTVRPELAADSPPQLEISTARATHILYGDETGGGHIYGSGSPCKTEFPQGWDAKKILETAGQIAANEDLPWRQEPNRYYVTEHMVEGVEVRVVIGPRKQEVITAYPVNLPRNPCPGEIPANNF